MAGFIVEYVKSGITPNAFGDPSSPVVGALKAKGFAALKASDQTIMKDMLQGKYLALRRKLLIMVLETFVRSREYGIRLSNKPVILRRWCPQTSPTSVGGHDPT
ncbi:hypothetical protein SELMODRAFT_425542 [Selaginella moellendorffii]|uniref:Uncharacterized protein n=1 Tax=Selaginella moellendorffii TaxID=88036 RepID=D8STF8_SELML|nr:hypothetical protein SELMODRAFT_425542 [Selaginella moellendorffii]